MPHTVSTAHSLQRELELTIAADEDAHGAMERIDRAETEAVCRHLLGDLVATGARS